MFSPEAAVPTNISARNPRRRQRTGSEDSVALRHNPKRIRRSILTSEVFQPPEVPKQNGSIEHVAEEPVANGHIKEPGSQRHANVDATILAIRNRGINKTDRERRGSSRNDGTIELVSGSNWQTLSVILLTGSKIDQKRELCGNPAANDSRIPAGLSSIRYKYTLYHFTC